MSTAPRTPPPSPVADADQRARALDVTRSFVVQAPAGSGKTGLLVQRFLALLARVERPEAVLAITFTRKAAAEMRERIVVALRRAARVGRGVEEAPADAFERQVHDLASAVLERDQERGWGLLHSPSRLQVFTIDGFSSRVVSGTPLLSRLGRTPSVVDDAKALYREAVRRTLAPSGREILAEPLGVLLERYELGLEQLEKQLIEMLDHRDQWSEAFFTSGHDEAAWVAEIETAFREAIGHEVASIAVDLDDAMAARIHDLARRSRAAGASAAEENWPTLGEQDLLGSDATCAPAWRQAAALLLKGKALRNPNGRPRDVYADDTALAADLKDLLEDFEEMPEVLALRWRDGLLAAAGLPLSATFSPGGREALGAFLAVLRHSYLVLWDVFREHGQVDHAEIAMKAVQALAPGETLDRLDARVEHVLVDEFQDTNVLQCNLLRGLTSVWQEGDGRTLFLVGDPMQSIYRFRKAEVGLFLAARSSPGFLSTVRLEPLTLSVNFRSTRSVVEWVNRTFRILLGDRDDATRSLVAFAEAEPGPKADDGPEVETVVWDSADGLNGAAADAVEAAGLADWIAARCREYLDSRDPDRPFSTPVAVLVRTRRSAVPLLRALVRRAPELRVRAPGLDHLADRSVVADLQALTRALLHPGDRLSWLALLRSPWVGLTLGDLSVLVEADVASSLDERKTPRPIPLLLRDQAALARLDEEARERIARCMAVLDAAWARRSRQSLDLVVRSAWLGLGGLLGTGAAARIEALDVEAFFDLLAERTERGAVDLDGLSEALASTDAAVDLDAEADVEIMTMHKAKGLEFDTVVLPALANGGGRTNPLPLAMETEPDSGVLRLVAPSGARGREDDDRDKYDFLQFREKRRVDAETLRLLYVAATRARRRLLLSLAHGRRNKNGDAPAGSPMAAMAPAVALGQARQETVVLDEAPAPPALLRFPRGFSLAAVPDSVADRSVSQEKPSDLELAPSFFADDKTAAHVGTVFHGLAERIAAEGLDAWPVDRVQEERSQVAHALRRAGVTAVALAEATDRVLRAVESTLSDERGRWILSAHPEARSEWAITALDGPRLTSAKLDRTFVVDGVRWIVDFKTGPWPGQPGEAGDAGDAADAAGPGVAETCRRYLPQLGLYRELLEERARQENASIRMALYFPEWPASERWQDVTDLGADGQAGRDDGPL